MLPMSLPSYSEVTHEVAAVASGFDWELCPSPVRRVYSAFKNAAHTACWMAFRAMLNIIPAFMILLGFFNLYGCPIEPYIPKFLIWMGILLIVKYLIDLVIQIRNVCIGKPQVKKQLWKTKLTPIDWIFFTLALLLYLFGAYWILTTYGSVEFDLEDSGDFCEQYTYSATFIIIAFISVILLGILLCSCLCFGVLYWEDKRKPPIPVKAMARVKDEEKEKLAPHADLDKDDLTSTASSTQINIEEQQKLDVPSSDSQGGSSSSSVRIEIEDNQQLVPLPYDGKEDSASISSSTKVNADVHVSVENPKSSS